MASPYRVKSSTFSNVQRDTRIVGTFSLTTGGAVGALTRPSQGSNPATAGLGNLFTVTQLGTYLGGTNANVYQVTMTENYLKAVCVDANWSPIFALTGITTVAAQATASTFDPTTNSFLIFLTAPASGSVVNTIAAGQVNFEAVFINTTSPNSL